MEQMITTETDLRERSKKALLLGILSEVIPSVLMILVYVIYLFGFAATLVQSDFHLDNPSPVFGWIVVMMLGFCIAGIVMIVLGSMAWRKARAIGLEAKASGVRRPPMSVVAHVFGLVGLIAGIALTVIMFVWTCIFGIAGAFVSAL